MVAPFHSTSVPITYLQTVILGHLGPFSRLGWQMHRPLGTLGVNSLFISLPLMLRVPFLSTGTPVENCLVTDGDPSCTTAVVVSVRSFPMWLCWLDGVPQVLLFFGVLLLFLTFIFRYIYLYITSF